MIKSFNGGKKNPKGYHLGNFFIDYMRKRGGNEICQIDAGTGQEETVASLLSRSIRLATCFMKFGLVPGDHILVGARNHLDAHIPFYAGMMSGQPVACIDPFLKCSELIRFFDIVKPKIAFCDYAMYEEHRKVVNQLNLSTEIVTFGGGENSFSKFMEKYQDLQHEDEFQVATFNPEEVFCWLVSTSGSTGLPKMVAVTHAHIVDLLDDFEPIEDSIRKNVLNIPTLHWISGCYSALLLPAYYVKVQTSALVTTDHVIDIINKYKPVGILCTPTALEPILHHEKYCDLSCFKIVRIGGSKVRNEFLINLKTRTCPNIIIHQAYGLTETGGIVIETLSDKPFGSLGTVHPKYEAKIISTETGKEILEPNVTGELLVRGPSMALVPLYGSDDGILEKWRELLKHYKPIDFLGYYNDPVETKNAFTEDGYFKTGDLFYKDENGYYYFVDRMKLLLKYKNYQIVPSDVEEVILKHPGVADVCVTGVPHPDDGEHVVACVVRKTGHHVTANDIKELVASELSASKNLHGGVIFLDAVPVTTIGKVAYNEVKKIALTAKRE